MNDPTQTPIRCGAKTRSGDDLKNKSLLEHVMGGTAAMSTLSAPVNLEVRKLVELKVRKFLRRAIEPYREQRRHLVCWKTTPPLQAKLSTKRYLPAQEPTLGRMLPLNDFPLKASL